MENEFKIKFSEKYFTKGDILSVPILTKAKNLLHIILYKLGCRFSYSAVVKGEPKKEGDGWVYEIEPKTRKVLVFGIKIWERKTVKF